MTDLVRVGYVVEAHASWSKWAARCGLCPNGTSLQRLQPTWDCWICGTTTEIIWPHIKMIEAVERLLMMRPDPTKRNWFPGETLHDLMLENAEHGILPMPEAKPGELLMVVDDHGIRVDNLPALKHRVRKVIET